MKGCKYRLNTKCTLFSNEWAEARCYIKNEAECPYHEAVSYTKHDKIRAMTVAELSAFLNKVETDGRCGNMRGRNGWLEWLQQETDA